MRSKDLESGDGTELGKNGERGKIKNSGDPFISEMLPPRGSLPHGGRGPHNDQGIGGRDPGVDRGKQTAVTGELIVLFVSEHR